MPTTANHDMTRNISGHFFLCFGYFLHFIQSLTTCVADAETVVNDLAVRTKNEFVKTTYRP